MDNNYFLESAQIPWDQGSYAVKSYMEQTYGRRGAIAVLNRLHGVIRDPQKQSTRDEVIQLFKDERRSGSPESDSAFLAKPTRSGISNEYSSFLGSGTTRPKPRNQGT